MKFYDREQETKALQEVEDLSEHSAQLTYIMGRRRIGKTALVKHAFTRRATLYLFVSKKSEVLLCEEFAVQAERILGTYFGRPSSFASLFRMLMQEARHTALTVVIDEFQTFLDINPSVFSDMQNVWDEMKDQSRINLVCCGSMYHLMKRIFEDHSEPLYGRATFKMVLRPFSTETIKLILSDHNPHYTPNDLLCLYLLTGGVAKYIEQLMMRRATTCKRMLREVLSVNSFFLTEGQDILVDEFGRDYATYFSILSLLAQGYTSRGDMESVLGIELGGYLQRLEKWYGLIRRRIPFMAKAGSKNVRYVIDDKFLSFWFRFIYKYRSSIEIGNLDYVLEVVERDFDTYSGRILEDYFKAKLAESKRFTELSSYWNRKGEDEIDIIAVDERSKNITCYEVKRQAQRVDLAALDAKSRAIAAGNPSYTVLCQGLSMEDM